VGVGGWREWREWGWREWRSGCSFLACDENKKKKKNEKKKN
jgi:hypothetical protein